MFICHSKLQTVPFGDYLRPSSFRHFIVGCTSGYVKNLVPLSHNLLGMHRLCCGHVDCTVSGFRVWGIGNLFPKPIPLWVPWSWPCTGLVRTYYSDDDEP